MAETRHVGLAVRMLMLLLVIVCGAAVPCLANDIVVEQLDISQPRTFGYRIGDKFERTVALRLRHPWRLDRTALPPAGRFSEWLAIEAPQIEVDEHTAYTSYQIRFTYQVINVNAEFTDIAVPRHLLQYSDGHEALKVLIPATRIGISTLRPNDRTDLAPSQIPPLAPFDYRTMRVAGLLLMVALGGLVFLYQGWPTARGRTPFMRAGRRLRQIQKSQWNDENYREALQTVHRAFNQTAGKTVFVEQLDAFFAEHSAFEAAREPIREFFLHTRDYFFGDAVHTDAARYSQTELVTLVRRCGDIERGLA